MDPVPLPRDGAGTRYYPPRWRLLMLALTCGVVVAVCAVPTRSQFPPLVALGWLGVALFLAAAGVLGWRALRPGPTVEIGADGITDRTTLAPLGLVRWDEIAAIRKKEIGRGMGAERLLEIVLADPERFRTRPRGWAGRLVDRWRALLKQPTVSIPGSMVSAPMQAVMDEIRRRRPHLQVLEGPPPAPPKLRLRQRPDRGRRHPDLPRW